MAFEWLNRLADWKRRKALRARLDEELNFHLDRLTEDFERRGFAPEEARRRARRELGNTTLVQEAHRERAGLPWIEEWARDAVLAVRNLRRRPGYAASMVGMLGVGLAATLTVFVLTDAMLRQSLPVPRPAELHLVTTPDGQPAWFSRATIERLQSEWSEGTVVAYAGDTTVTVQRGDAPARSARGQLVMGSALSGLELQAAAGRLLTPMDDRIGAGAPVAVANHAWAVNEFGSAAGAVGQEISVNRQTVQIVGVLPAAFRGFDGVSRTDLFMPTALQPLLGIDGNANEFSSDDRPNDPDRNRENRVRWLEVLLRVPAGVPAERVTPAVEAAAAPDIQDLISQMSSPAERETLERSTWRAVAAPAGFSYYRSAFTNTGRMLTALVVSLLVLTCANLSGLMLVRTLARHREMGVRLSLGAGRWRTCRLTVVEALVCGLGGALLALLLVQWTLPGAARLLAPGTDLALSLWGSAPIGVLVGVATACGVACALVPAWWLSRLQPLVALQGAMGTGRLPQRLGRVLVAVQLAVAVLLVAVAFSLGREIADVLAQDPGYDREVTLTARFDPRTAGYEYEDLEPLYARLKQAAEAVPGVERIGFSATGILSHSRSASTIYPRGEGLEALAGNYQNEVIDVDFASAVGLRLERGRWFAETDSAEAPPVALVSQSFARKMWGTTEVLGKRMGFGYEPEDSDLEVVGVVSDARINRVKEDGVEIFYVARSQFPAGMGYVAVRTQRDPAAVRARLKDAFGSVEPGLVFGSWQTLGERMESDLRSDIASSRLAGIVAGLALILAMCGVGGSLAHLVTLRQKELALRMALGATPQTLLRDVLFDGLRLGVLGALGGAALIGALAWGLSLITWWNATPSFSVAVGAAVCGLLAALLGGWLPARRASRVDPQRMLKAD
ncbi:ABC transporter permease [Actomonas aquatica]|uniref:ABC transporter permease n=1 Tax=Actomonas aquatica TaxID=2866162 RepID=A0ABZ1C6A1_9BACT|nr:ABC transporter permease [Opitutus sp. WL0086]WRQ87124.1 ABC transporter permease [Opitutus sp. WL0086]